MNLDEYHRDGRKAAAQRNRSELGFGMDKPGTGWPEIRQSIIVNRLTIWALVIGGLLGLASRLLL